MVQERVGHAGSIVGAWLMFVPFRWPASATPRARRSPCTRPYDGSRHRRGPGLHRRRRRPRRRLGARPRWRPARCRCGSAPRSSTPRPGSSTERREDFARIIATEAAKPIKTARVEAERARRARSSSPRPRPGSWRGRWSRSTPPHRARGSSASPCAYPSAWSVRSRRSTSRSTWSPTSWRPAIAAGCPVVLKPASQTPFSLDRPGRAAHRRVRPARRPAPRRHRRRRHGRQRHRRPPGHRADHLHRLAARSAGASGPGAAQAGRAGAGQQRAGHHRARRRLADGGGEDPHRRLLARRPELHLDAAHLRPPLDRRRLHRRAGRGRPHAGRRRPARRGHRRVGAHLAVGARAGRVVGRGGQAAGAKVADRGRARRPTACCARPCSPTSRRT